MEDDKLVTASQPYNKQLIELAQLRDNDVLTDKQLTSLQRPVTEALNTAIKLLLKEEAYLLKWAYKDNRRANRWAHRDKVREMKKERRAIKIERRAAELAEKAVKRSKRRAERNEKKNAAKAQRAAAKAKKVKQDKTNPT